MGKLQNLVNRGEPASFWRSALTFYGSATPRILPHVAIVMAYALAVEIASHIHPWIAFPIAPFEYAGAVLGLILVFRINAGYERWWEARKLWGEVVNNSRNLAIIFAHYTHASHSWVVQATNCIAAMPFLMKNFFRDHHKLEEVRELVSPECYSRLQQSHHKPNCLSGEIAGLIQQARNEHGLDAFAFHQAEGKRGTIIDCQGACERIYNTPMPFVMAIKTRRFILLYLLILPLALVDLSTYITPVVSGIIAYALFSLDQIGMELQNPFSKQYLSHLPLNTICQTVHNNINEIQKRPEATPAS